MRVVSPLLDGLGASITRGIDAFSSVPADARRVARLERGMPGFDKDPVVIVPGLTADRWMYHRLKSMLDEEAFVTGGMHMRLHGWADIPGDAKKLHEVVERTIERAQRTGRDVDHVQLVGDSEGGLIARQYAQFVAGGGDLVSKIITNGTPHAGIRPFGSDRIANLGQRLPLPGGVKDLLVSSPVMDDLNADWAAFLVRARAANPQFEAHSIASRFLGLRHDGLVPERAALMQGELPVVHRYVTDGAHSINLAFGRRHTDNGQVLLAALGSNDPAAIAAAQRASALAQATDGVDALVPPRG